MNNIQSEAELENNLIKQLENLEYKKVVIRDEKEMFENLKKQLEKHNSKVLNNSEFSKKEFEKILHHLNKGTVYYNLSINLDEIDKEILKALKYLKVSEEEFKKYIAFTNARLDNLEDITKNKINSITIQLNRKKSERTIYIKENMHLKKDKDEQKVYEDEKKRLNEEIRFLRKQIEKEDDNERNEILELEMFIDMLNNAEDYYKRANYVQKGKIAKILFLNIKIDHQKRLLIQPKAGLETLSTLNWWR